MHRPTRILAAAALLLASAACSSGSGGSGSSELAPTTSRHDIVMAADIPAGSTESAWDIVQRLHPDWLRARIQGTGANNGNAVSAQVFVDGRVLGDVTELRQIQAPLIGMIRYYSLEQTKRKFGMQYDTPAIEIVYKR